MIKTFYASFGAGYRRTEYAYDDSGVRYRATRHAVFPDLVDGRGYVEVQATDYPTAHRLAHETFEGHFSGIHVNTSMWDEWVEGPNSAAAFKRENGTLCMGRIYETGKFWGVPPQLEDGFDYSAPVAEEPILLNNILSGGTSATVTTDKYLQLIQELGPTIYTMTSTLHTLAGEGKWHVNILVDAHEHYVLFKELNK